MRIENFEALIKLIFVTQNFILRFQIFRDTLNHRLWAFLRKISNLFLHHRALQMNGFEKHPLLRVVPVRISERKLYIGCCLISWRNSSCILERSYYKFYHRIDSALSMNQVRKVKMEWKRFMTKLRKWKTRKSEVKWF